MPRKSKQSERRKGYPVGLDEDEKNEIDRAATRVGLSRGTYMRARAVEAARAENAKENAKENAQ